MQKKISLNLINQTLTTTINQTQYNLKIMQYNQWCLDIADGNNKPLVTGVPLLEKTDLLEQHQYAGFACQLFCQITSDKISLYFISKK